MVGNNDIGKVVVLYKRVSTEEQVNNGHSLDEQERIMINYCEIQGYNVKKIYADEGFSGKETTKRKAFNQMMKDIKAKKFDKIIALKLDRITRDLYDFVKFTRDTEKYGCGFEFVLEKFDTTTPAGRMIMNVLGVFAQFEREIIRERTIIGVRGAIEQGHYGGPIPFGYKKDKDTKHYLIDEETAPIVKEIFNLCLKGKTYQQISSIMKEKYGFITYTRRDKHTGEVTKKQKSWRDCTIGTILNNKVYYGVWEHKKKKKDEDSIEKTGHIPPIITKEIFDECQDNIKKNSRNYYRDKQYLFMQKLVCPKCGRIMACNGTRKPNGKDYLYYKCKDCKTYFREDLIETSVINKLEKLLELYLVVEKDYVPIDTETLNELTTGKIDNSVRYALDTILIDKVSNNFNPLTYVWGQVSYEAKCRFISEYIDTIQLKQRKRNGKSFVELIDLKLKPYKMREFLEMKSNNILDEYIDSKISYSQFNSRDKANQYINTLIKKYNIEVTETPIEYVTLDKSNIIKTLVEDNFITENVSLGKLTENSKFNRLSTINYEKLLPQNLKDVFKIIEVRSNRAVEKDCMLFLKISN